MRRENARGRGERKMREGRGMNGDQSILMMMIPPTNISKVDTKGVNRSENE